MERRIPTNKEALTYLKEDRNSGRRGDDDQKVTKNMVTPEKRPSAASAVKISRAVSLSRESPNNPTSASAIQKRPTKVPNTAIFRHS